MAEGAERDPPAPPERLRVTLAQLTPRLRDVAANARAVAAVAAASTADLVVTPELSLTGYDLGDSVHRVARPAAPGSALPELAGLRPGQALVVGLVERADGGPFNVAAVVQEGMVTFRHRKIYLPTYGMFDEARWFGHGTRIDTFTHGGWRAGLLVCEDFWHPGLAYVLASRGIDLLIVQAAAPGRGVWEGGEHEGGGLFRSADVWERMARVTAQQYGIFVVLVNRTGVEGGVTFAGGSLVAGPDGEVLLRAHQGEESVQTVELARSTLEQARIPYAHARDDLPRLVATELLREETSS
jgi:predicted amidohydrolase